ncbi:3-octaprenyl-4-hydroxybenzoate carboxy-lyase [Serinibacter arcticus]|uniref:3-octaprenyl-4-hydroxybenzoate carboxy-lyase n=1 Tax=Serinibacter arcticus TaxID=1655435 RepID=A0A2U1ZY02_9MICO|nr:3-octaprenyl-4-hydroxybenzoate carboxy-lyase [Serinibacter arcticus]PWD51866.1 3-octaprenyl-4-hydroxybenzoate carboxy-lyase [Serinibacter arcticus]
MSDDIPLIDVPQDFPNHVFDALGAPPLPFDERIGGSVMVVEKRPEGGPITLMTAGVARLPVGDGLPVELAVEVVDGQQGAAFVALQIVCGDIAQHRRRPPFGNPWRNGTAFLGGTEISAIVATGSRWGAAFDEVRDSSGTLLGHVRTLRLLTDAEAAVVAETGWDALVGRAGSLDALLDVTRAGVVPGAPPGAPSAPGTAAADANDPADPAAPAVVVTRMHDTHPPRWLTLSRGMFQSVTGGESPEYMDDADNHQIVSTASYVARFPWTEAFTREAREGQTARFGDTSGSYELEED